MSVYVKTLTLKDHLGRLPVPSSPSWLQDGTDWTQTVLSAEAGSASAAFRCSVQSLNISLARFMDLMFI